MRNQIPSLVFAIIFSFIECICLNNYFMILPKLFITIGIILIQLMIIKISFVNKYSNDFTLDGKNKKIRVKRKYLFKEDNQHYYHLNIEELLPGDIILLKKNGYIPCDGLIINGECLVSESNLTGSLNIYKKEALKNNSEYFNYKYSDINIVYHGMKIIKILPKYNNEFISVLSINIGPNTYKANQYSNVNYIFERKNDNNKIYNLFGKGKKIFLYIIINLIISLVGAALYYYIFLINSKFS